MQLEKFEKDMEVFSFKQHREAMIYIDHLRLKGWTIEDTREWVKDEQERMRKEIKEATNHLPKCPECGIAIKLLPVNINPETRTGDPKDKSVWMCRNQECMYTIYNKETIEEVQNALRSRNISTK